MRLAPLTLLLACLARPASALVVTPQSVQAQLDSASLVAEIDVHDVAGTPDPTFAIVHRATARVTAVVLRRGSGEESERGTPGIGDEIVITGPGGEVDDKGVFLSGFARPARGKRYRAHLNRRSDGAYAIAGFESGLVPLSAHRLSSRNRTDGSNGDGTGPFLFWDDSYFPLPYFISAPTFRAFPEFVAEIDQSFAAWRNVPDTRVEIVAMGCSSATRNENDGTNNVVLVSSDWPFDPAAIAITRNFYVSGTSSKAGMILDSDILLNGVNHGFTTTGEPGEHDVRNIVTHEAGHFLGLGHEIGAAPALDMQATMYAVASPNEYNKRELHANDIAGITQAYHGTGKKFPQGPVTAAACQLGVPSSCVAVHQRGIPRLFGLDIGGAWLALLLLTGRWMVARAGRI